MAHHTLSDNFASFFNRLNPSPTFEQQAAREHKTITALLENPDGRAAELSPRCFLQGSYKQQTAIYTINDVDIVALCQLWNPGSGTGRSWSREEIMDTLAAPLRQDRRYKDKVDYHSGSMCIKLDLGIKVEILPVVYQTGNHDPQQEPFRLYRPEKGQWQDGYARYHQARLSWKNRQEKTEGNFIPAIKVFKHLRSQLALATVSFHIECLLFSLPDYLFLGSPADYIPALLGYIALTPASDWYGKRLKTPCGERDIFGASEWTWETWEQFHKAVSVWAKCAHSANQAVDRDTAIEFWQLFLGADFFPKQVSP